MRIRMRWASLSACLALAAPAAFGAGITIAGARGSSAPVAVARGSVAHDSIAGGSVVRDSGQPTISYWQYRQQQAQSRQRSSRLASSGSFRYGNGLRYRPSIVDRSVFRYRLPEYRMRRYGDLRGHAYLGRFGGRERYAPGVRYTNSFGIVRQQRFGTDIRYGFARK